MKPRSRVTISSRRFELPVGGGAVRHVDDVDASSPQQDAGSQARTESTLADRSNHRALSQLGRPIFQLRNRNIDSHVHVTGLPFPRRADIDDGLLLPAGDAIPQLTRGDQLDARTCQRRIAPRRIALVDVTGDVVEADALELQPRLLRLRQIAGEQHDPCSLRNHPPRPVADPWSERDVQRAAWMPDPERLGAAQIDHQRATIH